MLKRWKSKLRRGERGQALVEFGLVAVVFFTLLFGIFDLARLFESWIAVQHASREGARYAITGQAEIRDASSNVVCFSRAECIIYRAEKSTAGLTGGGVGGAQIEVQLRAWDFRGTHASPPWQATATAGHPGKECDQIEVRVNYTHKFITPVIQPFAPSGLNIHGTQRMTNEPFLVCIPNDGVDPDAGGS